MFFFFFSSRRRHTRWNCDWSSDVCSSDLEVGHLGQDARGRPGEQPGQGGNRLGSQVRGRAAEAAVADQERDGQAEQRLDGEEYGLPAGGDGAPEFELAELAACLTYRQIQIVNEFGHMRRLLLEFIWARRRRVGRYRRPVPGVLARCR